MNARLKAELLTRGVYFVHHFDKRFTAVLGNATPAAE